MTPRDDRVPAGPPGPGVSLATWLWLVDLPGWRRALHLGADSGMIAELARRFEMVHHAGPGPAQAPGGSAARTAATRLPYRDGVFDCISALTVPELLAGGSELATQLAVLCECRRVLVPGGCICLAAANPSWLHWVPSLGARRTAPATGPATVHPRRVIRLLRAAGFREVVSYYADPSCHRPVSLIPVDGRSARAFDTWEQDWPSGSRRIQDALGAPRVQFQSRLVLACA